MIRRCLFVKIVLQWLLSHLSVQQREQAFGITWVHAIASYVIAVTPKGVNSCAARCAMSWHCDICVTQQYYSSGYIDTKRIPIPIPMYQERIMTPSVFIHSFRFLFIPSVFLLIMHSCRYIIRDWSVAIMDQLSWCWVTHALIYILECDSCSFNEMHCSLYRTQQKLDVYIRFLFRCMMQLMQPH